MKKLFPIPLLGAGTADVESFASYIHRLAFEHGLFVGELLRYIHRHAAESVVDLVEVPKPPRYVRPEDFLRPNALVDAYVLMTGLMASQELKRSTLWFLSGSVGRSANEIVKGFRWCPDCFAEMERAGLEPYYKLVWHLSAITHCPIHSTPLQAKCSFCGCGQTSYRKYRPIGLCQRCGKPLSARKSPLNRTDIEQSWAANGADVLRLFADIAQAPLNSLPQEGLSSSLSDIFDHYWRSEREIELYRLVDRDLMLRIIEDRHCISLKVARRIAYRLGVSLSALLSGDAIKSSSMLDSAWFCEFPPGFVPIDHRERHNHDRVLSALQKMLSVSGRPPSKKEAARKLEVSIGYLEYRFPALMAQIVRKHHEFVANERNERKMRARHVALEYFVGSEYKEASKSRKQAYRVLRQETGLPKFMLKDAISDVYSAVI
jgi:hypothetical protein